MSIATVITLGYGSFAGVQFIPTLGYGAFGETPTPAPTQPPTSGGKARKHRVSHARRWAVWDGRRYHHFDTSEEAFAFLYPDLVAEPKPKRRKKRSASARLLGPSLQPRVTYADQDIAAVTVEGMPGDQAFGLGDRLLAAALQRRIEQEIERREREKAQGLELERMALEAALRERERLEVLAREQARLDDEIIALLLLAA